MIGRIRGTLVHKRPPEILVEVAGVGYEIQVPMTTLFRLPGLGADVSLLTHFVVREDAQLLYGFIDEQDRSLFRQLIKVNGVGPKLALTILSGMDSTSFVRCVQREDMSSLVALPGVGRKTAERLLIEMRDKLKDWLARAGADDPTAVEGTIHARLTDIVADAEGALIALGYKPQLASRMVAAINDEGVDDDVEFAAELTTAERGDFELLCLYDTWDRQPNRKEKSHVKRVRVFRRQRTPLLGACLASSPSVPVRRGILRQREEHKTIRPWRTPARTRADPVL